MIHIQETLHYSSRKDWSDNEIEYLRENIGKIKVDTIAQHLNRSRNSVILKMKRLGIRNTREQYGRLTAGELAGLLHVDGGTVRNWIDNHGLPSMRRTTDSSKRFRFIVNESFWKWAYENKEKIHFASIEKHSIPPEPDWVEELRKHHPTYQNKAYNKWTLEEERCLYKLRSSGMRFKEISKQMNRSVYSLERRYKLLTERQKER